MIKRALASLAMCCALTFPVAAQQGHDDGHGHDHGPGDGHGHAPEMDPAAMAEMMKMMQPGEHHAKLDFFAGTWKATVKNPMTGEESEGTYSFEWTLGKRVMVGTFSGSMMGQPYEGMSIDGYDNLTGEYYSLWMDTMGTGYTSFTGKAEEDGKVVYHGTGQNPMTGGEVQYRSVVEKNGEDGFTYSMFMSEGGQEVPMMEMSATRM